MTVTKDTIIAEILQNDPAQGCVPIFLATGMHCLGCMAAHGETVEQACAVHGVNVDALLEKINDMGTTVLVVTHERELVNRFSKRVVAIESGRIISDASGGYYGNGR